MKLLHNPVAVRLATTYRPQHGQVDDPLAKLRFPAAHAFGHPDE
jgi:hypothetical protein